jgi:hypothetical protein
MPRTIRLKPSIAAAVTNLAVSLLNTLYTSEQPHRADYTAFATKDLLQKDLLQRTYYTALTTPHVLQRTCHKVLITRRALPGMAPKYSQYALHQYQSSV